MPEVPAEVMRAAHQHNAPIVDKDRLKAIRDLVAAARAKEEEKADLETRLKATNLALNEFYFKALPDAFDEVGISSLSIPAEGNHPAIEAQAAPYYRANIAADWNFEKRREAFDYLVREGHGDLIKTEVVVSFPRGKYEEALAFAQFATDDGLDPVIRETVPWSTLSAWLKEQVEKEGTIPDLDLIGGTVGRQVKLKKEK